MDSGHCRPRFRRISRKLVFLYILAFLVVMSAAMASTYILLGNSLRSDIEQHLAIEIDLIREGIAMGIEASMRNYFRATVDAAESMINEIHAEYRAGLMSENDAKKLAMQFMEGMRLGPTGYMTAIDAEGLIVFHPEDSLVGASAMGYPFISQAMDHEENFFDYDWNGPGMTRMSRKMMYSRSIDPWGWVIGATGYREELRFLVSVRDLEEGLLGIKFGESGYPVVLGYDGTFLIHPEYQGVNMARRSDSMGDMVRTAMNERNGTTEYLWKNPGESQYRRKLTVFADIPQMEFIVAATAYESEFFQPLRKLDMLLLLVFLVSILLIFVLTIYISRTITNPIIELRGKMDIAAGGDLDVRVPIRSCDELGSIESHFNRLISQLQEQQQSLRNRNRELIQSLEELRRAQDRLIREERLSNMGRFVSRISHHLGTPLGIARTAASHLKSLEGNPTEPVEDIEETLDLLDQSLDKAARLVHSFRRLNLEGNVGSIQHIHLGTFLTQDIFGFWKPRLPDTLRLVGSCAPDIRVNNYPEALKISLNQLIENSLRHSFRRVDTGQIRLDCRSSDSGVQLIYADTGVGIPTEFSKALFEPFFSVKNDFKASGIGLNVVYNVIVHNMQGTIEYTGDSDTGVRYIIMLPNLDQSPE